MSKLFTGAEIVFKSLEDDYDFVVLELSSYQLDYIRKLDSHISVILNLSTDHLERHETLKNYFSAKLKIFDYAKHKVINNNLKNSEKDITFDIKNKSIYINSSPIDNLFFENYNFVIISIGLSIVLISIERFNLNKVFWACLGFIYICLPSIALIGLRGSEFGFSSDGFIKMCYIIFIVIGADVGAYLGGSYFKGPKLSPVISPNKTWSGFISGLTLGVILGGLTGYLSNMGMIFSLSFAVPIVLLSVVGDLFESGIKRVLKLKTLVNYCQVMAVYWIV